jgi:lipopolysaccharide transport system ATP-binding protein
MSSEIAIKVEDLGKCYQIYNQPRDRLKQFVMPRIQRMSGVQPQKYYREFWALKDVSFEVKRGESVGIVGRNGSGKSTLLQMICGTLNPTSGTIQTNGRIAALLELGSGFNPEFSGRENVYLNAALLGLSKEEIDARYEEIVEFADIGDFVEQPVKTYSSGMMVRLAFAVQAQVEPDILIVDEALAVGDAKFQARCFNRLRQLKENGASILLVTHASEQIVTHCSHAILLNAGSVLEAGEPRKVVNCYIDLLFGKEKKTDIQKIEPEHRLSIVEGIDKSYPLSMDEDVFSTHLGYNSLEYRWGDGSANILDFCVAVEGQLYPTVIITGQHISLGVSMRFMATLAHPILSFRLKTKEGVTVYATNSELLKSEAFGALGEAGTSVRATVEFDCSLAQGDYFVSLGIATLHGEDVISHDKRYDAIHLQVRFGDTKFYGIADLDAVIAVFPPAT